MNDRCDRSLWSARLVLVLLTFVAFFPALKGGFITWDDPSMIMNNPHVHDLSPQSLFRLFTGPYMGLYQPLTILSLALQYHLTGLDPFFLHLANILLHLANVVLAFELARKLGMSVGWAFATALLFAVHPTRAESVAWLTERKDVLFTFFYLLGLNLHVSGFDPAEPGIRRSVFTCFLLSLMSKPSAISFPFVIAVLNRFKGNLPILESLKRCRYIFILVGIVSFITFTAPSVESQRNPYQDSLQSGVIDRFARVFLGTGVLIRWLAVPNDVPLFIPYFPVGEWPADTLQWSIAALAFCILLYTTRNQPLRQFGLLFFLACLLPVFVGIFFHGMGQGFTAVWHGYLPAFGFFLCMADCLAEAVRQLRSRNRQAFLIAGLAVSISCCAWLIQETRARCGYYEDGVTFWSAVIRRTPHYIAFNNLGMARMQTGDYVNALQDFRTVTTLQPQYRGGWIHLAATELSLGRPEEAGEILEKALKEWPDEPLIHDYLGLIAAGASRAQEAIAHYSESLRLDPGYVSGLNNRAAAYQSIGETKKALADLETALRLEPFNLLLQRHKQRITDAMQNGAGD